MEKCAQGGHQAGQSPAFPIFDCDVLVVGLGPVGDVLAAALLCRDLPLTHSTVALFDLSNPTLEPFREALTAWLTTSGAQAVLVRPDRHVFGTGAPLDLLEQWDAVLTQWYSWPARDPAPKTGLREC
jgi:hypothetical protein